MNGTKRIVRTMQRKAEIAGTKPSRHTALRRAAESLSRRNADAAVCELLNEALAACVRLCYEKDDDGQPSSIDPVTLRLLVPVPWGRAGHRRWGLRPQESNVLRAILFEREQDGGLFLYDRSRRSWLLNVAAYPSLKTAAAYLERYPVGVAEYRAARDKHLGNI